MVKPYCYQADLNITSHSDAAAAGRQWPYYVAKPMILCEELCCIWCDVVMGYMAEEVHKNGNIVKLLKPLFLMRLLLAGSGHITWLNLSSDLHIRP